MFQPICQSARKKVATVPGYGSPMAVSLIPDSLPIKSLLTGVLGGQSNMYMQNHRCKVTGSTSTKKLGKPKPAVYCRDNPTKCVPGPKQMMVWHRKSTTPE